MLVRTGRFVLILGLCAIVLFGFGSAWAGQTYTVKVNSLAACVPIATALCAPQSWIIEYNPITKICTITCDDEPV
ncbi:MAG TPA: hypothetical protein VLU25_15810 [Acidobacteriota bacterium]|nr:hypothetical protein [Acidobacteriota bacterium]